MNETNLSEVPIHEAKDLIIEAIKSISEEDSSFTPYQIRKLYFPKTHVRFISKIIDEMTFGGNGLGLKRFSGVVEDNFGGIYSIDKYEFKEYLKGNSFTKMHKIIEWETEQKKLRLLREHAIKKEKEIKEEEFRALEIQSLKDAIETNKIAREAAKDAMQLNQQTKTYMWFTILAAILTIMVTVVGIIINSN